MAACSNNKQNGKEIVITRDYIAEQAQVGLSAEEVKKIFGEPKLTRVVDITETWLYYTPDKPANYQPALAAINHQTILVGVAA